MNGPKICRLEPQVVQDRESLEELRHYLMDQLASLNPNIDPHSKLEFAKMTIRTKALELSKKLRNIEKINLQIVEEDIKIHERLMTQSSTVDETLQIALHLERQTNEKNKILETQGKNLAWKARTKWYNEGERSNKYFLNLLKRNNTITEMDQIQVEGRLIKDPRQIGVVVNEYYTKLYNNINTNAEPNLSYLKDLFKVTEHEIVILSAPITLMELWSSLKPLKDTAPGPDGISHIYLKKLWDIIGPLILDSWHYALLTNKMTHSHERSYLRLIPKAGKDTLLLTNWRPITLSNCDHKLITRVYNNRLVNIIGKHISSTQTAYIKGRNITDNIRLLNSAIQLANNEPDISGSIIALDAKKAFDSVSHNYTSMLLNTVGLDTFVPIFKLLYGNLSNDTVVGGRIVGTHQVKNGVKQGDALSCTLFILAMEPLLKSIEKNDKIKPVESRLLGYKWPMVVGYADDVTCVIKKDHESMQAIFDEYGIFSANSGLVLNADKTEIYNFGQRDRNLTPTVRINYLNAHFEILPVNHIQINGIILCQNLHMQKDLNCHKLIEKMDRHFKNWSHRHLSLLGKIQIYKTFGLSQFLYHLAVFEPNSVDWKVITKKVNAFLWSRNYAENTAPPRIKKEVLLTPIDKGGFGMIELSEVVTALRLKRHFHLLDQNTHPLSNLVKKLVTGIGYLGTELNLDLDKITKLNLRVLVEKRLKDCKAPIWQLESERILHANILTCKLTDMARPGKRLGAEINTLHRRGMFTFKDIIMNYELNGTLLRKITQKDLIPIIEIITRLYRGTPMPNDCYMNKIKDLQGRWIDGTSLSSKKIREIIFAQGTKNPKLILLDEDDSHQYFSNISKLVNVANKSRVLRLLYRDVYCADRRMRFGMSDSDQCRRCFGKETIIHLLVECPYTKATYALLGMQNDGIEDALGINLSKAELEIRCDILNFLVFKLHCMPPEVLVKSTLDKYAEGLVAKANVQKMAKRMLRDMPML
jgi:hypothetical protein